MVFCNSDFNLSADNDNIVTILILIDGFLQSEWVTDVILNFESHNPYFNRWFSAIIQSFLKLKMD